MKRYRQPEPEVINVSKLDLLRRYSECLQQLELLRTLRSEREIQDEIDNIEFLLGIKEAK